MQAGVIEQEQQWVESVGGVKTWTRFCSLRGENYSTSVL